MYYPKTSGVYCLHCIPTGKKYIGGTTDLRRRIQKHKDNARTSQSKLYQDIRKYGFESFIVGMIEEIDDIDLINEREPYFINLFNTIDEGYNKKNVQPLPSVEARRKMSKSATGRVHTEETKQKLRGRVFSDEHKRQLSEAHKGTFHPHTEETKRKISSAKKGRVHSDEHKRKISQSQIGRVQSDETKRKIQESVKAYHQKKKLG